jgi:hypothetical protein
MLAWEIARQWQSENCMTPFEEILGWHLSGGLIHSTKDVFLLAQEVIWDPVSREILQPSAFSLQPSPNAWFTELAAAGTFSRRGAEAQRNPVKEFLRVAPHPHEFVLWCRQSKGRKHDIHSYKWDHLARRVGLHSS